MASIMLQIAQKVGVSTATVSLALRDKGRMAEKTRQRIKAAAKALDYHAHPVISQACSLARRSMAMAYRDTLALITEYPMENCGYYQKTLYESARERAVEMGYRLEVFRVSGNRSEQQRISRVLKARGIRGMVIIPRLGHKQPRLHFEWGEFAAVEVHRTLWSPRNLHHIDTVDYHKILEALHLLKKVGFQRVGMAVEPAQNHSHRGVYLATSVVAQERLKPTNRIPALLSAGAWNEKTFRQWMMRHEPDVLYIHHNMDVPTWLKKMGLRVPEDISLFCANVQRPEMAGLRRDFVGMGRAAVELVALLLGNNALGLVGNPRCWLVDEIWQAGATLKYSIEPHISKEGFLIQ